jgi:hypothetical protein
MGDVGAMKRLQDFACVKPPLPGKGWPMPRLALAGSRAWNLVDEPANHGASLAGINIATNGFYSSSTTTHDRLLNDNDR